MNELVNDEFIFFINILNKITSVIIVLYAICVQNKYVYVVQKNLQQQIKLSVNPVSAFINSSAHYLLSNPTVASRKNPFNYFAYNKYRRCIRCLNEE